MKQDLTTWKFRTQKSDDIIYSDFEDKFRDLPGVHCIHTIYHFESGSQKSNTSNGVQIRVEIKKLWPFEDNCAKLKDHFKIQLMNSKSNSKF